MTIFAAEWFGERGFFDNQVYEGRKVQRPLEEHRRWAFAAQRMAARVDTECGGEEKMLGKDRDSRQDQ